MALTAQMRNQPREKWAEILKRKPATASVPSVAAQLMISRRKWWVGLLRMLT